KKRGRLKRGGDQSFVSFEAAEESDDGLLDSTSSPDLYFDRQWAIATISRVVTEFEADLVARGKQELFDELRPFLMGTETDTPQQEVAQRLGMEPNALSNLLQRWRSKLGKSFRAEVAATIPSENSREIEAEIVYLKELFGSDGRLGPRLSLHVSKTSKVTNLALAPCDRTWMLVANERTLHQMREEGPNDLSGP
ncbi:MAG: hypothetical protein ACKVHP_24005, partial [Verrucomicrobiales bacterium]